MWIFTVFTVIIFSNNSWRRQVNISCITQFIYSTFLTVVCSRTRAPDQLDEGAKWKMILRVSGQYWTFRRSGQDARVQYRYSVTRMSPYVCRSKNTLCSMDSWLKSIVKICFYTCSCQKQQYWKMLLVKNLEKLSSLITKISRPGYLTRKRYVAKRNMIKNVDKRWGSTTLYHRCCWV